jgi:YD repeat-containing protein
MLRKLSIMAVGLFLCLCFVTTALHAQANPACRAQYQYWAFDPLIPGASCENEAPFLDLCTVGTSKCTATCWECLQNTPAAGGPINLANGNVFITQTDITIPGLGGGLNLSRTWNSEWPFGEAAGAGMFGGNWRSTYEESIFVDGDGLVKYVRATGGIWTLGLTTPEWPLIYVMIAPANGGATLIYDGNTWTLTYKSGEKRVFDGPSGHLLSIIDRNGNTTQLTYDASNRLTTVTDPASRHLTFTYASPTSNLVTGVSSDVGISLTYAYDNQSRLSTITKPDLTTVSFQYDSNSLISAVLDSNNKVLESHTYDGQRRGLTSSRAGGVDSMSVTYPILSF